MRPVDDWCSQAQTLWRIGQRILTLEKRQEGHVNPEPRERADWWLRLAEEFQRKHEERTNGPA